MEQMEYEDALSHDGFSQPNDTQLPATIPSPLPQLQTSSHDDDESFDSEYDESDPSEQEQRSDQILMPATSGPIKCPDCPRTFSCAGVKYERHAVLHKPDSVRRFKCSQCNSFFTDPSATRKHEKSLHGTVSRSIVKKRNTYDAARYSGFIISIATPTKRKASIDSRKKTRELLLAVDVNDDNMETRAEPQQMILPLPPPPTPAPPLLTQHRLPSVSQPQTAISHACATVSNNESSTSTSSAGRQQSRPNCGPNMFVQINTYHDMCIAKLKSLQDEGEDRIGDLKEESREAIREILQQLIVARIEKALTGSAADSNILHNANASAHGFPAEPDDLNLGDLIRVFEMFKTVCTMQAGLATLGGFGSLLLVPGLEYALSIMNAVLLVIKTK